MMGTCAVGGDWAAVFGPAVSAAEELVRAGRPAVLAIDGRCGSGKTSLAALLARRFECQVVHMDDFYLPFSRRAPDWEEQPGGNMDFARLQAEVLAPARAGTLQSYRPYDCHGGQFGPAVPLPDSLLLVLEGSYALHPALSPAEGKLFLTCARQEQERRLRAREGERFSAFAQRWIPMEERYYAACGVPGGDCLVIDTSGPLEPA